MKIIFKILFVYLTIFSIFMNISLYKEQQETFKKYLDLKYQITPKLEKHWYVKCYKDGKTVTEFKPKYVFSLEFGNVEKGRLIVDYCIVSRKEK